MARLVWFDALTSKQMLIAASLKRFLQSHGYDVLITGRRYDAIEGIVKALGIDAVLMGGYGGDAYEKLREEISRMGLLLDIVSKRIDDLVAGISYPNPLEARIVYGLGKPLAILSDTPHSIHAHRLTVPLAAFLIHSWCIDGNEWSQYLLPHTRLVSYRGVDELSWVFYLEEIHDARHIRSLGLSEREYVVIRPEESKASYYTWGGRWDLWVRISEDLVKMGYRAVILPRYSDQRSYIEERLRSYIERERIIIPPAERSIGPALAKHSLAVITGGGTMAREAALYGVPGVTLFPLELSVDRCLSSMGFPIRRASSAEEAISIVAHAERSVDRLSGEVEEILRTMEPPQKPVLEIIRIIEGERESGSP